MKKRHYIIIVLILLVGTGMFLIYPSLKIMTGYAAKNVCSCVFVAEMEEAKVLAEDVGNGPVALVSNKIDYASKMVRSTVFGLQEQTAIYREGLGCALVHDIEPELVANKTLSLPGSEYDSLANWFDYIDTTEVITREQSEALSKAVDWAFMEEEGGAKNTRGVCVVYQGRLVAEGYGDGFDKTSRFQGWSMTKSITALLYGILSDNGLLSIEDDLTFLDRPEIKIKDLLQMSSGLEWEESYATRSAVTKMLFESDTMAMAAMRTDLTKEPGTFWEYSSGTTNLLAYGMRQWLPEHNHYLRFPYDSLFRRIGMYSMIMEPDASGHFVGSSYSWATARDWAKLGTLLWNNGDWAGERILSEEWIQLVREVAPASKGLYGGQFWLNDSGRYTTLPKGAYSLDGFNGQKIMIVPSLDLVIVRLGLTHNPGDFDFDKWFGMIVNALK